jgi:hypothetical protein
MLLESKYLFSVSTFLDQNLCVFVLHSVFFNSLSFFVIMNHSKWAINIDNCKVSLLQLGNSMKQDGWVDAYVINAFCRKLFKENHPRKSNKHFFFHTVAVSYTYQ